MGIQNREVDNYILKSSHLKKANMKAIIFSLALLFLTTTAKSKKEGRLLRSIICKKVNQIGPGAGP
jgi:hypothetical protein